MSKINSRNVDYHSSQNLLFLLALFKFIQTKILEYKTIILFTELYCKTFSLILIAEHRLRGISEHDVEKHIFNNINKQLTETMIVY